MSSAKYPEYQASEPLRFASSFLLHLKAPDKLNQAPHGDARRPLGDPAFVFFHPGGTGNVEMQPWRIVDELFQEDRCGAGAAPASAGVHDVGDVGADLVEIFLVERQTPEFFS